MREEPVERRYPLRPHPFSNQVSDGIVDHGAYDRRLESEAVGEIRGHVELGPAHMNVALSRLPKWDHARIETVVERSKRDKVEGTSWLNAEAVAHGSSAGGED